MIHTAEGARDVVSLGNFFANPASQVSSHVGIDDERIEQYVDYNEAAFTVRSGNAVSENAELCGFAAWSRDQWLGEHRPMLQLAALWIRERCQARGIPIVKLSPADVAAGRAGVIGHVDWTLGMRDGSHTDPGPNWPWAEVIAMARGTAPNPPTPPGGDDMTPEDHAYFAARFADLWTRFGVRPVDPANPAAGSRDRLTDLWDAVQHVAARVDRPSMLSDADVDRIAARVVAGLPPHAP